MVAAIVTLILGYLQVRANTRVSHATLLLELDARWDSDDMKDARRLVVEMNEQIMKAVSEANPMAANGAKHDLICAEWRSRLAQLRKDEQEKYGNLVGMVGFYETLGLMVKRNYVAADDALGLFKGPILNIDAAFRQHMAERGKEIGVPKGLFEHAFYLCDLAKRAS